MQPFANLHHPGRALDIGAVGVVCHVRHGDKGMVESLAGSDSSLLVHGQHPLQQVDELAPVDLFGQKLAPLEVSRYINLTNVRCGHQHNFTWLKCLSAKQMTVQTNPDLVFISLFRQQGLTNINEF